MKNLKYFVFMFISFFVLLSVVKAEAVCVYKQGDFGVTCTANNNRVNCVNNSVGDIKFNYNSISLSYSSFVFGSDLMCPSNVYLELYQATGSKIIEIKNISISSGANTIALPNITSESKITNDSSTVQPPSPSEPEDYENDPDYIAAKKDAELYCNPTNFEYQDDSKCAEAKARMNSIKDKYVSGNTTGDGKFDTEHPCQGRFLGVFTTIGWVFFIIKIVVPIILIIFGTIDVSKAIVSSKDDEIKKSVKTLAIRAIAGIVIFFIPTFINLLVSVIGNKAEDIYNSNDSKFLNCTKCMLKPNQSNCTSLVGGK